MMSNELMTESATPGLSKDELIEYIGYMYSSKAALRRFLIKVQVLDPSVSPISSKGYHRAVLAQLHADRFSRTLLLQAAGIDATDKAELQVRKHLRQIRGLRSLISRAADPR